MEAGIEPRTYLTAGHCANYLTNAVAREKENKGLQELNPGLLGHEVAPGPLTLGFSVGEHRDGDPVVVDLDPEGLLAGRHRVDRKQVDP